MQISVIFATEVLPFAPQIILNQSVDFKSYWNSRVKLVDQALQAALPKASTRPATIHKAMRYSIFAGGKRLRPILCLATAEALGGKSKDALSLACALECIHTYSLIHDDLPCMDDDDLRRGKPTSHKVFGEAMAVLAGDGLLTHAFQLVAAFPGTRRYTTADAVKELAVSSGSLGIIAGQVADIEGEGKKLPLSAVRFIHENKTAALIRCSIRLGAIAANASEKQWNALSTFGQNLGLAFQVIDDILDVTQTSEKLGKSAGKDLKSEKSTYPAVLGLKRAQKEAQRLTDAALQSLKPLSKSAGNLPAIAAFLLDRQN